MTKLVFTIVAIGVVAGVSLAIGWLNGGVEFSDGYRDGHVQKFSTKGVLWKTHEGELALPGWKHQGQGDTTMTSNVWDFTVIDPEIIKQITALNAEDFVRLYYHQKFGSPFWLGDTGYFVYKVEKLPKPE